MYANIINVYEIYIYNIHQEYIDKKFKIKRTSECSSHKKNIIKYLYIFKTFKTFYIFKYIYIIFKKKLSFYKNIFFMISNLKVFFLIF